MVFYPVTTIICITKAIGTNDSTRLDQAILPNNNFMIDRNISPQTATRTNMGVLTNEATRTDDNIIAEYNTRLYDCIRTNRNPSPNVACGEITALGAISWAGWGVVSIIWAMRA